MFLERVNGYFDFEAIRKLDMVLSDSSLNQRIDTLSLGLATA